MNNILLGALGEQTAAQYLRKNGYRILSANYKTSVGEIDIIALKDNILCFEEVKTRKAGGMTAPAEAVDYHKAENVRSSAAAYMNRYSYELEARYDIIEVIVENDKVTSVNHIINAF